MNALAQNPAVALSEFAFAGATVRVAMRDGEPWWAASDVARILEIQNVRQEVAKMEEDEKGVFTTDTPGGAQDLTYVNESGLYALVFKSRKPVAKAFRRWVTGVVLPSIRRTGNFAVESAPLSPVLPQDYKSALRALLQAVEEKEQIELAREKERPMVEFYHAVAASDDTLSLNDAAKALRLGRNRMMMLMRRDHILTAENLPYQRYVDTKLFRVVVRKWKDGEDKEHVSMVTRVSPRGLEFLRRKYARHEFSVLPAPSSEAAHQ